MAVAETLDVDPMDVEELNEVVDPDALDRLVRTTGESAVRVTFTLAGCSVTVDGSGTVDVTPTDDARTEAPPTAVASPATESTNFTD